MRDLNFVNLGSIDSVKLTSKNKLRKSTGFFLQHAKDTMHVFDKETLRKKWSDDFALPSTLYKSYKLSSAKASNIEEILADQFMKVGITKFAEVYARNNNVSSGWTSFGDQLSHCNEILGVHVNTGLLPEKFLPSKKNC